MSITRRVRSSIIKPPNPIPASTRRVRSSMELPSVFLAGSIEMGKAENWQIHVENLLEYTDCVIFNPRRDDWDSSWVQSVTNPQFTNQVTWELMALEKADVIALYLDPATKSPISLLELGLHAGSGKLIVCSPEGFYRKGNVDIVCLRYGVPMVENVVELVKLTRVHFTRRVCFSRALKGDTRGY